MSASDRLHLAGFAAGSRVNGPGLRAVLWVQGCSLNCPGCFNPDTHAPGEAQGALVAEVADQILTARTPETVGVTFSGGEPFQQAEALSALAREIRSAWPSAHLLAFSGYTLGELRSTEAPRGAASLLSALDMLIDGRFEGRSPPTAGFRGSGNQRLWVLGRPPPIWPEQGPLRGEAEIQVGERGQVLLSGFPDAKLKRALAEI